jgi:hypothetical protein
MTSMFLRGHCALWRQLFPGLRLVVAAALLALPSAANAAPSPAPSEPLSLPARILADTELTAVLEKGKGLLKTGLTAGTSYGEVWIRDLNTFIELSLQVNDPAPVRDALLTFFKFQGPEGDIVDGYIPQAKSSVGYKYRTSALAPDLLAHKNTVETDQEASLVQAVRKYVRATGDYALLDVDVEGRTVRQRLAWALEYLLNHRFDPTHGLLWGATTADWGDVQPEHTWGVELDESSHRAIDIYDNAMFLIAIRDYLALLGPDAPEGGKWRQVHADCSAQVRKHLWDKARHKFVAHLYLQGSPFPPEFDEASVFYHGGTAVAIEAGLLERDEIKASLEQMRANVRKAEASSIGLTLYPVYPEGTFKNKSMGPYSYQNGGDWCWFGGRMIQQLIRYGFMEEAYRELKPMVTRVLQAGDFHEWWSRDNQPRGSARFRGSAGVLGLAIQQLRAWAESKGGNAWEPRSGGSQLVHGVCTHFAQGKGHLPANLHLMKAAGVGSIRDEVSWSKVEREKGVLRMPPEWDRYVAEALESGIAPMLILDYGNRFYDGGNKPRSEEGISAFVRYCEFVVRHFKGKVHTYEVWNEYDIGIGVPNRQRGSADDYVELLRRVYLAIKAIDPGLTVLGGGMTAEGVRDGWLKGMLDLGGLAWCDAVSIHTYIYSRQGRGGSPETWAGWMQKVQELLGSYHQGQSVPLYITEMGWPTHVGERGMSQDRSAEYLARLFLLGRTMPFLRGIWWYDFQDDGWRADDKEDNFGMVRPDLTPKPSFHAFQSVAKLNAASEFLGRMEIGNPEVWILRFRAHDGSITLALWTEASEGSAQVVLSAPAPRGMLSVEIVGSPAVAIPWGYRGWAEGKPEFHSNQCSVWVSARPTLLTGNLAEARIERD